MHYTFCRVHEALRITPAMQLGLTDHVWSIGELIDAALDGIIQDKIDRTLRSWQVVHGGK
jgi:hypothetical protein